MQVIIGKAISLLFLIDSFWICIFFQLLHSNKFLECYTAIGVHGNGRLAGGLTRSKLLQDPRVLQSLGCCQPGTGVLSEEAADEILCRSGNTVPVRTGKIKPPRTDMLENLIVRIAIERRVPTKQNVCNYTNAPVLRRKPEKLMRKRALRCSL